MAAASKEEEEKAKRNIKDVLKEMESLPREISELLQHHRGRRLITADDSVLRFWNFAWVELSGIVASLNQMYSLPELGPDYADEDFQGWLHESSTLAYNIGVCVRRSKATLRGCQHCFSRDAGLPLPRLYVMQAFLDKLTRVIESPSRYKHLRLVDDNGDPNSKISSSYAADAGGNMFLVGIEGALRNKKLRWFMADRKENETVRVISMVGPAGVGKTTLAMEVYRQLQQIRGNCFQCCATAKVSQRSDSKELLKHILSQIHKPPALLEEYIERSQITTQEDEELKLLAGNINQCLQGKRYLVLIDNILKESDWNIIKNAFPQNSTGSRIIITTQLRSVAQFCCSHYDGLVHEVKPLNWLDSERLLCGEAFGSEDGCPPENLKRVCDEILERCEGIPLFITGMADWLKEQQEVQHISTNCTMEIVPKLPRQFEQSLAIIYDELPYYLKVFLMYISMFQGYMFDKYSPIQKSDCQRIFPYDVTKCFSELVDRNIITRVAATHEHTPKMEEACTWQVNYFMLQFLASKSAGKAYSCTSGTLTSGMSSLRRMSLHKPDPELPTLRGKMDLSHTRSLAICGTVEGIPHLDKFIYLVMLDLTGWQRFKDEYMVSICKMFLLRHLSLRNTGVNKLPPAIKNLQQLQILDVSHTQISDLPSQVCELALLEKLDLRRTPVRRLPEQIWMLRWLQCLLVGGDGVNREETVTEIPEEVEYIGRLKTLATVDLSQCSRSLIKALGGIEGLEVLAITWSFHQCTDKRFQEALHSSITNWRILKSLTIHCGLACCMDFLDSLPGRFDRLLKFKVSGGRFASLPKWFDQPNCLTFIQITVCTLLPGDLGVLGVLPSLECLVLGLHFIPEAAIVIEAVYPIEAGVDRVNDSVPSPPEAAMVIDRVGFQKLERLSVCCRVPWLTFMQGAMPVLTFLELKTAGSPASEKNVPSGVSNLLSLSDVAIRYHTNYINSPNVKMTVEAVRKEATEHFNPINLFINGILEEYVEAVEEDSASATGSQRDSN